MSVFEAGKTLQTFIDKRPTPTNAQKTKYGRPMCIPFIMKLFLHIIRRGTIAKGSWMACNTFRSLSSSSGLFMNTKIMAGKMAILRVINTRFQMGNLSLRNPCMLYCPANAPVMVEA